MFDYLSQQSWQCYCAALPGAVCKELKKTITLLTKLDTNRGQLGWSIAVCTAPFISVIAVLQNEDTQFAARVNTIYELHI